MTNRSDIVFSSLPLILEPIARFLSWRGFKVFYVQLPDMDVSGNCSLSHERADRLKEKGINPLPIEHLKHLFCVVGYYSQGEEALTAQANQLAPLPMRKAFEKLYPDNSNVARKLLVIVNLMISRQHVALNPILQWARAHSDHSIVLIFTSVFGMLAFGLPRNVKLVVLPVDMLERGINLAARSVRRVKNLFFRRINDSGSMNMLDDVQAGGPSRKGTPNIAFVVHQGVSYGDLYEKSLFYSTRPESELYRTNILHLDYSGFSSPSTDLNWVHMREPALSILSSINAVALAAFHTIGHIRAIRHFVGLLLLMKSYLDFKHYYARLFTYRHLKLALIDYEVLCPKGLLLAFEARKIRTVAAQERFILPFYLTAGTILDTYFVGSEYVIPKLSSESSCNCIDEYIPVGQYRSDNLVQAKNSEPPAVLTKPILEGRKIVTALGFHTHLSWHKSEVDPILNWSAHLQFLSDMTQLAKDIPDIYLVLRFKTLNWIGLPVFTSALEAIKSSGNVTISDVYNESFYSYRLCAHSDLVIAKHTSLADECLSVGIPVLFHDYTPNTDRLFRDVFDYEATKVICSTYRQLLERSRIILSDIRDDPIFLQYEFLKEKVYGRLGDGHVRQRINTQIEQFLKYP